uniref:FAD/NAD(P)-binding domain-containing protein n=1 Tax=Ditylenchus dipsaci TaxID=166011 RepID=A0A915E7M1_9BILA
MITEFKQKHTQITISHIDRLKEEIRKEEDFEESNADCQLKQNIVKIKNEAENGINLYPAVIYSKLFMRKAYSVGGPASWLNIYSFAQYISDLDIIIQLSRLQSKAINLLIFDYIYTEHVGNKQKTKLHGKAIVVGCGPAGLYSSFYAFESGMSIDRVDDRNCFTRTHIIVCWRYIHWNFIGEYNEYVRANLKELETALDFQLSLLGKYVRCKTDTSASLSPIIKAAVNRIQFPTQELPHFTAKLDTGKNAVISDPGQGIEFNFMIISSGAKSRLRSAYVNVPTDETVKERYSVATFVKGSKLSGIMLVPEEKEGFVTGNRLDSLKAFENMQTLGPFLKKEHIEDKNNSLECDRLMMQLNRKYLKALTEAKLHQTVVLEGEHINTRNIISIDQKGNALEENPSKLHFDPVSVNTSTFNLTQMSMKYSATQYTADYIKGEPKVPSEIMVTFGDAFATPHHLTEEERNASSFNRMCETINDIKNRANIFGINGFKIVSDGEVSAENSTFGIEIDGHKTYMAEVTNR